MHQRVVPVCLLMWLGMVGMAGCAVTTTFTLSNGTTVTASEIIEETPTAYIIREQGTAERRVLPQDKVVAVNRPSPQPGDSSPAGY